jgi:hypothetical protein
MKIIGAGMAGLLCANMLRRHKPVIYEKKESLPSNHSAVLRFRNETISRATGIPFKKVLVHKGIMTPEDELVTKSNLRLSNMYAQKVSGAVIARSILNMDPVERFIAPAYFVQQMASSVEIEFGMELADAMWFKEGEDPKEPIISTIPMPALMKVIDWTPVPEFKFSKIWTLNAVISSPEMDVFQTIYYPDPDVSIYRASITGNHLTCEFIREPGLDAEDKLHSGIRRVLAHFGISEAAIASCEMKVQPFGKITPINELQRKQFIFQNSDEHHIYSLGRFATWRNIILDDLVNDIQFIEGFITQRDLYSASKSLTK